MKERGARARAIVSLKIPTADFAVDLDVPLDISADELLAGINEAYALGIDAGAGNRYLKAENPVALLRGETALRAYGVRNGTVIYVAI